MRGKIACLKTLSRHELMQDKTSGTCTTGSAPSKTSKRDLGNVTKKTCTTNCTRYNYERYWHGKNLVNDTKEKLRGKNAHIAT